ncbi:hypothetical protein D3C87_1063880 [compost metagenome]
MFIFSPFRPIRSIALAIGALDDWSVNTPFAHVHRNAGYAVANGCNQALPALAAEHVSVLVRPSDEEWQIEGLLGGRAS